jgi:hypothetical protein
MPALIKKDGVEWIAACEVRRTYKLGVSYTQKFVRENLISWQKIGHNYFFNYQEIKDYYENFLREKKETLKGVNITTYRKYERLY